MDQPSPLEPQGPPDEPRPPGVIEARPIAYARPWPAPRAADPLTLPTLTRGAAVLDLLLALLVLLVVPLGIEFATAAYFEQDGASDYPDDLGPLYPLFIIRKAFDAALAAGVVAYFVFRHRVPARCYGLHSSQPLKQAGAALLILIVAYVAFAITVGTIVAFLGSNPAVEQDLAQREEFLRMLPLDNWRAALALMIPVAIHEELLFRGLLIPYLRRLGCTTVVAVVLSSAVFASLHLGQGALGVIQVFFVGLAFGWGFVRFRSLSAVIVAHMVFNLAQLQLASLALRWAERMQNAS